MKLCKDCKHLHKGIISPTTCNRPIPCVVYGTRPLYNNATLERQMGDCGLEAVYFEPIFSRGKL